MEFGAGLRISTFRYLYYSKLSFHFVDHQSYPQVLQPTISAALSGSSSSSSAQNARDSNGTSSLEVRDPEDVDASSQEEAIPTRPNLRIAYCTQNHVLIESAQTEFAKLNISSAVRAGMKQLCIRENRTGTLRGTHTKMNSSAFQLADDHVDGFDGKIPGPAEDAEIEDFNLCRGCEFVNARKFKSSPGDVVTVSGWREMGKRDRVCPYYASRNLLSSVGGREFDVEFLPFEYIFSPKLVDESSLRKRYRLIFVDENIGAETVSSSAGEEQKVRWALACLTAISSIIRSVTVPESVVLELSLVYNFLSKRVPQIKVWKSVSRSSIITVLSAAVGNAVSLLSARPVRRIECSSSPSPMPVHVIPYFNGPESTRPNVSADLNEPKSFRFEPLAVLRFTAELTTMMSRVVVIVPSYEKMSDFVVAGEDGVCALASGYKSNLPVLMEKKGRRLTDFPDEFLLVAVARGRYAVGFNFPGEVDAIVLTDVPHPPQNAVFTAKMAIEQALGRGKRDLSSTRCVGICCGLGFAEYSDLKYYKTVYHRHAREFLCEVLAGKS